MVSSFCATCCELLCPRPAARERPGNAGRLDGEPGCRWRHRVRLPGVHDVRLRGNHLLPRVLPARGRVRRESRGGCGGGERPGDGDRRRATVNYKEEEEDA